MICNQILFCCLNLLFIITKETVKNEFKKQSALIFKQSIIFLVGSTLDEL